MPELQEPKTPEEAKKFLLDWHRDKPSPNYPDDILNEFHLDTCVQRRMISHEWGQESDIDQFEALELAAIRIVHACSEFEKQMAERNAFDKAVALVGGECQWEKILADYHAQRTKED